MSKSKIVGLIFTIIGAGIMYFLDDKKEDEKIESAVENYFKKKEEHRYAIERR